MFGDNAGRGLMETDQLGRAKNKGRKILLDRFFPIATTGNLSANNSKNKLGNVLVKLLAFHQHRPYIALTSVFIFIFFGRYKNCFSFDIYSYHFGFASFFPRRVLPLQSDWSLSCDHRLDNVSSCENNNISADVSGIYRHRCHEVLHR